MDGSFYIAAGIIVTAASITVIAHKLTWVAALAGGFIAVFIFMGTSYTGLVMLAAFFILGTAATTFKKQQKQILHIAEANAGRRNTGQVLANGGLAALLGVAAYLFPKYSIVLGIMVAACFAAATADTLSSELGNVYGKKYYNILSLKKDTRGLDGVISLEGTLFGLAGSIVIAGIYSFGFGWSNAFVAIIIAGTAGNLFDSLLGASVERKGLIGNNLVNFLNTMVAALAAFIIMR